MRRERFMRLFLAFTCLITTATGCCSPSYEPGKKGLRFFWPAAGTVSLDFYGDKISGEWPGWYYDERDDLKFFDGIGRMHRGLDIASSAGTPVAAAAAGIARRYDWDGQAPYGNRVVVEHGNTTWTLYAHLQKILITDGQAVNTGDVLGEMGTTGKSTGPHLHFEIRHDPSGDYLKASHYIPGKPGDVVRRGDVIPYVYPEAK